MKTYTLSEVLDRNTMVDGIATVDTMNIDQWCEILNDLMESEKSASVAIVGYSLPNASFVLGCPLGDPEFEKLGALVACDATVFAAAEKTGLLAEGIDAIFFDALNNCGSWSYHYDNVKHILSVPELRKYVSFSDRFVAERLMAAGEMLCENDDLWYSYSSTIHRKLMDRNSRGF